MRQLLKHFTPYPALSQNFSTYQCVYVEQDQYYFPERNNLEKGDGTWTRQMPTLIAFAFSVVEPAVAVKIPRIRLRKRLMIFFCLTYPKTDFQDVACCSRLGMQKGGKMFAGQGEN